MAVRPGGFISDDDAIYASAVAAVGVVNPATNTLDPAGSYAYYASRETWLLMGNPTCADDAAPRLERVGPYRDRRLRGLFSDFI